MPLSFLHRLFDRLVVRFALHYIAIYRDEERVLFYRFRLFESRRRGLCIYLHKFVGEDWDDVHDHPWAFGSMILAGRYLERRPGKRDRVRGLLSIGVHGAYYRHTTKLLDGRPCWTLMVCGRKHAEWGFYDEAGSYRKASGTYKPRWRPMLGWTQTP